MSIFRFPASVIRASTTFAGPLLAFVKAVVPTKSNVVPFVPLISNKLILSRPGWKSVMVSKPLTGESLALVNLKIHF